MKRKPSKIPVFLTLKEITTLFEGAVKFQDEILIKTLFYFGLRVTEGVTPRHTDFLWKEKIPHIKFENSKGKKERRMPIPAIFFEKLKKWSEINKNTEYLFCNSQGMHLSRQTA